jgi:hypothetical protein
MSRQPDSVPPPQDPNPPPVAHPEYNPQGHRVIPPAEIQRPMRPKISVFAAFFIACAIMAAVVWMIIQAAGAGVGGGAIPVSDPLDAPASVHDEGAGSSGPWRTAFLHRT